MILTGAELTEEAKQRGSEVFVLLTDKYEIEDTPHYGKGREKNHLFNRVFLLQENKAPYFIFSIKAKE